MVIYLTTIHDICMYSVSEQGVGAACLLIDMSVSLAFELDSSLS